MKILQYVIPLVTGAFIGYITNWIAIKMLFRPYKEKYIGKIRIPFTPGLIPKERRRISNSISSTISEYLLTDIMVIKELKSDRIIDQIRIIVKNKLDVFNKKGYKVIEILEIVFGDKREEIVKMMREKISRIIYETIDEELKEKLITIINGVAKGKIMDNTMKELLGERFDYYINNLSRELSPRIIVKLKNVANSKEIEEKIYNTIKQEIDKKMAGMGFLGMLGGGLINAESISNTAIDRINLELDKDETKVKLEEIICDFINDYSDTQINKIIPENYQVLLYEKIKEFIEYGVNKNFSYDLIYQFVNDKSEILLNNKIYINEHINELLCARIISFYDIIVSKYSHDFIESIGIGQIIEREINAFDTEYLEQIIIKVAHKELSAITKLGALIGFILAGVILIF